MVCGFEIVMFESAEAVLDAGIYYLLFATFASSSSYYSSLLIISIADQ